MNTEVLNRAIESLPFIKDQLNRLWVSHHANRTDWAIEECDALVEALRKEIAQPSQAIPKGFALVPIRTTRAMEAVFQEEGWEWADVLAAAEAVTEAEYEEALDSQPSQARELSTEELNALWTFAVQTGDPTAGNTHLRFARAIIAAINAKVS